jgi:type IV pilus assembly protein PilE
MQNQTTAGPSGNNGRNNRGFTLIELMITVAIVAILAAVAYPSYTKQIIRGQRSTGQNFIMDLAQRQEQYFNDTHLYATNLAQLGYASLPPAVIPLYQTPTFGAVAGPPAGWNITLAPASGSRVAQVNDGSLVANSIGERFRTVQGNLTMGATDCTFENGTCVAH